MQTIEIPMTKDLQEFLDYNYKNQTSKLVDEFLIYLNTRKEAYEINKALQEVKQGKTNSITKLLHEL